MIPKREAMKNNRISRERSIAKNPIKLKPYFRDARGYFVLYHGDCLDILQGLKDIDLIFADPPYFLSNDGFTCHAGKQVSVNKGKWDKSRGVSWNHDFNRKWLSACRNALEADGSLWVSGTQHAIYSIGFAMQELGFKMLNSIVWFKTNAPPNLSCRYFTHSHETIIWAAPDKKSRHVFNYKEMKAENLGRQMRDVWSLTAPGPDEKKQGKHPTQKPLKLLERIIRASTQPGDLVLDPFTGSSTTGMAAVSLGRRFVGIDTERKFLDLSIRRFEAMNIMRPDACRNSILIPPQKPRFKQPRKSTFFKSVKLSNSFRKHA